MNDHESRTKRATAQFWVNRICNYSRRSQLVGERHILELISLGAPIAGILNKLCAAIDCQIGNVVSLVLVPEGEEKHFCSVTQSALRMGLHSFSRTDILARDKTLLGILEIYSCDPRGPTSDEYQLIERVVHLAAIALQRRDDQDSLERPSRQTRDWMGGTPASPPFIN
jgi:hypothetical protein